MPTTLTSRPGLRIPAPLAPPVQPQPVAHWKAEALAALAKAARRASPSIVGRLDLADIWAVACTSPWRSSPPTAVLPAHSPKAALHGGRTL